MSEVKLESTRLENLGSVVLARYRDQVLVNRQLQNTWYVRDQFIVGRVQGSVGLACLRPSWTTGMGKTGSEVLAR